jgi:hypothetical protein
MMPKQVKKVKKFEKKYHYFSKKI